MRPIVPRHYVCLPRRRPDPGRRRGGRGGLGRRAVDRRLRGHRGRPPARAAASARGRRCSGTTTYLYVYAELEEPHVWGTITKKNEVIFQDNDFEVFIDPDGDNHNYYEFEINALNTIWDLTLVKPYRDGGPRHPGTNLEGLQHGRPRRRHAQRPVRHRPRLVGGDRVPLEGPGAATRRRRPCPPKDGEQWRVNFSRVEWLVDIIDGKYRKVPKECGRRTTGSGRRRAWSTCTGPSAGATCSFRRRTGRKQGGHKGARFGRTRSAARDALMEVYYRQREFKKHNGHFAVAGRAGIEAAGGAGRRVADSADFGRDRLRRVGRMEGAGGSGAGASRAAGFADLVGSERPAPAADRTDGGRRDFACDARRPVRDPGGPGRRPHGRRATGGAERRGQDGPPGRRARDVARHPGGAGRGVCGPGA